MIDKNKIEERIKNFRTNLTLAKERDDTKGAVAYCLSAICNLEWVLEEDRR